MAAAAIARVQSQDADRDDYHFLYNPFRKAITVNDTDCEVNAAKFFLTTPLYAPFLFPNTTSDARDHAANERTYLSYLRLAVYLAVVSVAIFVNFHLKNQPTRLEQSISHPLGVIFFVLALTCLAVGFANYVRTVAKYARKAALVQSGLKTQIVFGVVSCAIIAACGVFLAAEGQRKEAEKNAPTVIMDGTNTTANTHVSQPSTEEMLIQAFANIGGLPSVEKLTTTGIS